MQVKKYKRQFEMYVNKPTLNELRKNRGRPNRRRRGSRRRRCTQLRRVVDVVAAAVAVLGGLQRLRVDSDGLTDG